MANPAAIDPNMPAGLLRHANAIGAAANRRRGAALRRLRAARQLIANSAVLLVTTAGSVVIYYGAAAANSAGTYDHPAYALIAFVLFLLGLVLVLLALVADQFPGAAGIVGVAVARALRGYFLGGRRN